jgi:hypothetical protein
VKGKTVTNVIPAGSAVERTREHIGEYHRFRQLVQQLIAVSEKICDLQLRQTSQAPEHDNKKTALDGLLAAEILWDVEALLGRQSLQDLDLEALEMAVRRQALHLAGRAVEQRLNADQSDAERAARCACGQFARYAGRREKTFQSVLGPLKLKRAYFHCAACGQGFCPRDRQLGLENTSLSPAVTRMVAADGAMVSFQEGSQLLGELAGVGVDARKVNGIVNLSGPGTFVTGWSAVSR